MKHYFIKTEPNRSSFSFKFIKEGSKEEAEKNSEVFKILYRCTVCNGFIFDGKLMDIENINIGNDKNIIIEDTVCSYCIAKV